MSIQIPFRAWARALCMTFDEFVCYKRHKLRGKKCDLVVAIDLGRIGWEECETDKERKAWEERKEKSQENCI